MIRFQMAADYLCILHKLAVLTSRLSFRPERSGKARRAAVVLIGHLELCCIRAIVRAEVSNRRKLKLSLGCGVGTMPRARQIRLLPRSLHLSGPGPEIVLRFVLESSSAVVRPFKHLNRTYTYEGYIALAQPTDAAEQCFRRALSGKFRSVRTLWKEKYSADGSLAPFPMFFADLSNFNFRCLLWELPRRLSVCRHFGRKGLCKTAG